jgi:hypothetical protein
MSRKVPRPLVLGGATAIAAGIVLLLGAATHGFKSSLAEIPASPSTPAASSEPAAQTPGHRLRTSVVALLPDPADGSAAVVVRIANPDPHRAITDALIATDLVDRAGRVVGTSRAAGTDPLRVHVAYVAPGQSVLFVIDTIATHAVPTAARVSASGAFSARRAAHLVVNSVRLHRGAFGWVASATLHGSSTEPPRNVLVEAVALRGRTIVAAGTASAPAPRSERQAEVDIFLTGDAEGGEARVWTAGP